MKKQGFTLIEALIAITIVTLAIAGPLYAVGRSLNYARNASNELTATYLAQEGVEYVRKVRDDAFLNRYNQSDANASQDAWTDFLSAIDSCNLSSGSGRICTYDAQNTTPLVACPLGSCTQLYLTANGYTQTSSSNPTPFTRTIQITNVQPPPSKEELITSKVTWNYRGTAYNVTITDHLTPWQ